MTSQAVSAKFQAYVEKAAAAQNQVRKPNRPGWRARGRLFDPTKSKTEKPTTRREGN